MIFADTAAGPGNLTRAMNRLAAWVTRRQQGARALVSNPEPRLLGAHARGRQFLAGNFLLAGHLVEAPGASPWEIVPPHPDFAAALHGFGWLDDLAAVGDAAARRAAQDWTMDWITRFGRGKGPGWTPDLAGRRLLRWICHALLLLNRIDGARADALFGAMAHHTAFVARRWEVAAPGLARIEALTGLLCAALSLEGLDSHQQTARAGLRRACRSQIDIDGGIASRNPEELLEIFLLLSWAATALEDAGLAAETAVQEAIGKIAGTLRTLRHADGSLARFHGSGGGCGERLDHALAACGAVRVPPGTEAMGYGRLWGGRTTVIVDAAPPPMGGASYRAHASTLAFELVSHRRPLVVNCGAGIAQGSDWERACRTTALHSTLAIDGLSSARMDISRRGAAQLVEGPRRVGLEREQKPAYSALLLSHDGYVASHGLTHLRRLDLSRDGRALSGEDMLVALAQKDRRQFDRAQAHATAPAGVAIRFHLHPEADAELDMNGMAVSVVLRSGEIWVFRHDSDARLALEPSVYLERDRLQPRATQQIVLSALVQHYTTQIAWSFEKAQDTPIALRDTGRDDWPALSGH